MTNEKIIELYRQTYSVTEVLKHIEYGRAKTVKILKAADVYEGLNGPNYIAMKLKKHKEVMQQKYGVDNISQLRTSKLIESNKIGYDKFDFDDELKHYTNEVRKYTKNLVTRKKLVAFPTECFYTNIEFVDVSKQHVNPNDPLKRTVDHKHPIILCYFDGWTIEQAGGKDNIIFVLRYVNSLKSNTTHECFLPIANKVKEKLTDAKV